MPGVEKCAVNLMTQKLTVNADEEKQEQIIQDVIKKMKKIDDDVVIYC